MSLCGDSHAAHCWDMEAADMANMAENHASRCFLSKHHLTGTQSG